MEIKFNKVIRPDPIYQNFDYTKYAVYDKKGKFRGNVFEHDGEFLTVLTNEYFETIEDAAYSLI